MTQQEMTPATQERIARAHQILDVAAELILRWGYNKTTVDDIAKQAGVGKGTVYLHWKTRDDLFKLLIRREQLILAGEFQQRILADPEGALPGNILKHTMISLMQRPLLKALVLGDSEVWGKLLQSETGGAVFGEKMSGFQHYLTFLQEHKLVRQDRSPKEQVTMWIAVIMGFLTSTPLLPAEYQHSDAEMAEMMADVIRNTFEPPQPVVPAQLREATAAFQTYVSRIAMLLQEQFDREIAS